MFQYVWKSMLCYFSIYLFLSVPQSSPMPLTCQSNKPTELTLSWKKVQANDWNGFQRHYRAEYAIYTNKNKSNFMTTTFRPQKSEGIIEGLKQFTKYTVYLMAETKIGKGPKAWVVCDTMEGGKYNPLYYRNLKTYCI